MSLRPTLLAGAFAAILAAADLSAQVVDDRMVPSGTVRLTGQPTFSGWDEAFLDAPWGRTPLGAGLNRADALHLFPGTPGWVDALQGLAGDESYAPMLGPVDGRVSQDVTRLEFGLDLGITEWWTVGATLPRVKNRTAVALVFTPDTLASDLGISPAVAEPSAVSAFLSELDDRAGTARQRANDLCGAGDPDCASATALADEAEFLSGGFAQAYGGTPFFPLAGSTVGTVLAARVAALDGDLQVAGLPALAAGLPLASDRPTAADLADAPVRFGALGYAEPLASRTDLWGLGDIEVRTLLRLLQLGDRGGQLPPWTVDVLGGAVVRLGTGSAPRADVPFALGTGDGQTDVELRLSGHATLGRYLSLHLGGRYGWQGTRTLVRRLHDGDEPLAPLSNRVVGEWQPGRYLGVEVEPGLRLARELTFSTSYRLIHTAGDAFVLEENGVPLEGPDRSLALFGAGLEYDTTAPGLDTTPFRFRIRWLQAVAGGGGAPAETRLELSGELFRTIWGGS